MLHASQSETKNQTGQPKTSVQSASMLSSSSPVAGALTVRQAACEGNAPQLERTPRQQRALRLLQAQSAYGNQAVLRMLRRSASTRPVLQRKCSCGGPQAACACEKGDEPFVQRSATGGAPEPQSVPPVVTEVLRSVGQSLSRETREFMEPRFGRDFSHVRIHNDARADASAKAVSARAYTVGNDIVFGAGEFRPETSDGRALLAHELTHTIQQEGAGRGTLAPASIGDADAPAEHEADTVARMIADPSAELNVSPATDTGGMRLRRWASCGTPETCPTRNPGEHERAARTPMEAGTLEDPVRGFIIWGFDISSSSTRSLTGNATWAAFDARVAAGSDRWSVHGFSDCEGGTELNGALRASRADAAYVAMSAGARAKLATVAGAPVTDCVAANDTEENRRFNRAVIFEIAEMNFPEERVPAPPACPPTSTSAVTSLADYISLIRCAESRTSYNPRQMLAMLRQLYYGKPWSFANQTSKWDNVIPCSPDLGHPEARLGRNLFLALGNSSPVGGVDIGHFFTGLEAMVCPRRAVDFYAGLATVSTPNEDFATWAGDLGAAVAAMVACPTLGAAAATSGLCGGRTGHQPLRFYLESVHASSPDLEGDIDPFVIRATALGIPCGSSGLRSYTPGRPISEILGDYYYDPSSAQGTARASRNHCFLELMGATFDSNGRVNNRSAVSTGPMNGRVVEFARAFYTNIAGIPSTPNNTELRVMALHAEIALDWFITVLETRAPVTP